MAKKSVPINFPPEQPARVILDVDSELPPRVVIIEDERKEGASVEGKEAALVEVLKAQIYELECSLADYELYNDIPAPVVANDNAEILALQLQIKELKDKLVQEEFKVLALGKEINDLKDKFRQKELNEKQMSKELSDIKKELLKKEQELQEYDMLYSSPSYPPTDPVESQVPVPAETAVSEPNDRAETAVSEPNDRAETAVSEPDYSYRGDLLSLWDCFG